MDVESRILVLAPLGRDAAVTSHVLNDHQLACKICSDVAALVDALNEGAAAALVAEEALRDDRTRSLIAWVKAQPRWSDFPFIVLGRGGAAPRSAQAFATLEAIGNIVLLERPLQTEALVRATQSALQARLRQYEIREFAATLEAAVSDRTSELEAARQSLAIALEAAEMGNWELDVATGSSRRSLRHDEIFGYAALQADWSRARFLDHVVAEDRDRVAAAFGPALDSGRLEFECRIVRADGELRWIAVKGRATYDDRGRPLRITGVISDVTDRKEADARLAQIQKMDTVGQLTGGVAHDFNNLLTPILGSLDILRRRHADDQRSQRLIGAAQQAGERAATLTQRLLAFARRQTLAPRAVDVGTLVDGLVDLVSRTLGPTVEIKVEVPRRMQAARVDPNQLELALLNLAVNARDAMPGGGRLTISASEEVLGPTNSLHLSPGTYIRLSTADEGVGMDPQTLRRAVEPFFSTKGLGKGTGLGLSMVHGLAAQSGGALELRSEVGKGTTVELWLPATEERPAAQASDKIEVLGPAQTAVVLLVDDEDIVRRATADMLADLGFQVVQATSGSRALSLLKSGIEVDVIVSDYLMPGMSGGALANELKGAGVTTPFLLITGYAHTADDVPEDVPRLSKPFRQSDLAVRVNALIAKAKPPRATDGRSLRVVE